jgi:hypothetical protein
MQFFYSRRKNDGLGLRLRTAILRATVCGHLARHGAIRTHSAHGHRATGSTGRVHPRRARQAAHRRLNRGEADHHKNRNELGEPSHVLPEDTDQARVSLCAGSHFSQMSCAELVVGPGLPYPLILGYFAVSAAMGTSMSSLRITMFVALIEASSKPCPCVIASVGQASTQ